MLVRSVREDHPLSSGQIDADGFGLPGLLIDAHFKVDDLSGDVIQLGSLVQRCLIANVLRVKLRPLEPTSIPSRQQSVLPYI
jgi:hypothetical protein